MSCCSSNGCKPATATDTDKTPSEDTIRNAVRTHYASILNKSEDKSNCCGEGGSCFAPSGDSTYAEQLGYTAEDLANIPDGANIGQGCGNPVMFAQLNPGETVLDLGSGAGFDAFIAARRVGKNGRVVGVDMTVDMITKSREKAKKGGYSQVEFRLGEIEHLPVENEVVDVVISNCVINLVPNKAQVFKEVARVLKKGGRVCISDVVTTVPLSDNVRSDLKLIAGCLAGATLVSEMEKLLMDAGLVDITVTPKDESKKFINTWAPGSPLHDLVLSALIQARKPQ